MTTETKQTHMPMRLFDHSVNWEYVRNKLGFTEPATDYIVRAVNAHDDLLEALRQVQIIIDAQRGMDRLGIAIAKAIAKAEGRA